MVYTLASQSVVKGIAWIPLGTLLEMQILRFGPGPLESKPAF